MDGSEDQEERVCRVCRSGEEGGSLYRPCHCKGSIQFVHEDCLNDWLSVSRGVKCELCKYPFRWQKVYAAEAPSTLPVLSVIRHLLLLSLFTARIVLRFLLVAFIWLALLPFAVRGAWQGFFHLGRSWGRGWVSLIQDVDWSQLTLQSWLLHGPGALKPRPASLATQMQAIRSSLERIDATTASEIVDGVRVSSSQRPPYGSLGDIYRDFYALWARPLSHATSLQESTPRAVLRLMRMSLHRSQQTARYDLAKSIYQRHERLIRYLARECFAGQIIVCCVVIVFVTVFLLREWVIANQQVPHDRAVGAPGADVRPLPQLPPPPPVVEGGSAGEPAANAEGDMLTALGSPSSPVADANLATELRRSQSPVTDLLEASVAGHGEGLEMETPAVPLSEAAQAFVDRQRQRLASSDVPDAVDGSTELVPASPVARQAGPVLPAADVRAHERHETASTYSSDSEDSLEHPHPARPNHPAGDVAPADLAAIEAVEAEEDAILIEADLIGILEAIGILGPLVALVQNAALITLLIVTLLAAGVWAPLMLGKTIAATNAQRLLLLPISLVRLGTDPIANALLRLVGRADTGQRLAISLSASVSESRDAAGSVAVGGSWRLDVLEVARAQAARILEQAKLRWLSMPRNDSTIDRSCCILLGYVAALGTAAICLRVFRSTQAQDATRALREGIKQQLVLLKAALFFMVEILLFPTLCGVLLNIATLPMLPGATLASRITYHTRAPLTAGFLTWLAGTQFMALFAQAIGVVRKSLRKGVLWFIRDPSDPEANPLREILETPAFNQAKKITRSAFVYGAVALTCFGTFPWLSALLDTGILPLRWNMTRPIASVPIDLIFVLMVCPKTLGAIRTRRILRNNVSKWCSLTAHQLRLSSFLLGTRRADEEGSHVRKTWRDWLLCKRASAAVVATQESKYASEVSFVKDGGFARVVASDTVKVVPKSMFIRVQEDGSPLNDEGARAVADQLEKGPNPESSFAVVYIPPQFKTRILLFIYLLWFTGSIVLSVAFALPLLLGRLALDLIFQEPIHDAYSIILGLHILLAADRILRTFSRFLVTKRLRQAAMPSPTASGTGYAKAHTLGLASFVVGAGLLVPLSVGTTFHLYVLSQFDRSNGPTISLSMAWCYGILLCYLGYLWAVTYLPTERQSNIVTIMRTRSLQANLLLANLFVIRTTLLCQFALHFPRVVTTVSMQGTRTMLWLTGRDMATAVLSEERFDRASVLSILLVTLGLCLVRPMHKILSSWAAGVWEREYLVERKLKNIDDPVASGESTQPEVNVQQE